MRRRTRTAIVLLAYPGIAGAQAQDVGIGLNDTRGAVGQQNAIAEARDGVNELAGLGAEKGGVSSALAPFAEAGGAAAGKLYDDARTAVGATAKNAEVGNGLMDGYIDGIESGQLAQGEPNNDTLDAAADHALEMACKTLPADSGACGKIPSRNKEAKITDRNVVLLCNPLSAKLAQVANNPKLVYQNECNWGVPDRTLPGGKRGVKTSTFLCNGWSNPSGFSTREGIPVDAKGYGGVRPYVSPVTGRPESYTIYHGARFVTPCRPADDARNPLKGGCFDPGIFLKFGNCDE